MTTTAAPPERPRPEDFLAIDRMLSDEERDIRDTVRSFVRDRVTPFVGDWFEAGEVPARELALGLGGLGVLGMHLEGYGCAGASGTAYGLACLELEAGDWGSGASSPSRARWRCTRSGAGARRSRRRSGCRGWRRERRSAASG